MNALQRLLQSHRTLVMPGVHDALSARLAEEAGFQALSMGGNAVGMTQLALPDLGMQSFGEFRDSVQRARNGSTLPCLVDGEDGYGDAKMVTRVVRDFEQIGVDAVFLEDLHPLIAGQRTRIVALPEIGAKLEAALHARRRDSTWIVGRTDAAHADCDDELIPRARHFQDIGVDAVLAFGVKTLESWQRLRDAVSIPLVAVVIEGRPWLAPTLDQLNGVGIDMAVYPVALVQRMAAALRSALGEMPANHARGATGDLDATLRRSDWQAIDARFHR